MRASFAVALAAAAALVASATAQPAHAPVNDAALMAERAAPTLAEYNLFLDASARRPNERLTAYSLNTQLYSDGALKFRYVYIPAGAQAQYNAEGVFDFPVGTVLIKTFAFAEDMRAPHENVRFLETRLLIRQQDGWVARPYVWNEDETEARYAPIGADVPVSFTDEEGQAIALDWAVPNVNQCAGCHASDGEVVPIGPSARNLNRDAQLAAWRDAGVLGDAPSDAPRAPDASNPEDGTLEQRARAYLDVNCAHCHNPSGPAHTSGLDLSWAQTEPVQWGVYKRPVAAGRGSAGMNFSIEPGHPERSILVHRMESTDPGVMMPELGRTLVDARAVALMRDWIADMDETGRAAN